MMRRFMLSCGTLLFGVACCFRLGADEPASPPGVVRGPNGPRNDALPAEAERQIEDAMRSVVEAIGKPREKPPAPSPAAIPNDAVTLALADSVSLVGSTGKPGWPAHRRRLVRYVWLVKNDQSRAAQVAFFVNAALSRASFPLRVKTIADGSLVRLDLYDLVSKESDVEKLAALWDEAAADDPYFYVRGPNGPPVKIQTAPYKADDGKTYDWKWGPATSKSSFGGHVQPEFAAMLVGLTGTSTPIMQWDKFRNATMTNLDGGRYYQFVGIRKSTDRGKTDLQFLLDSLGVDDEKSDDLRGTRRAAVFVSGVTKAARQIEDLNGPLGVVVYTKDTAKGGVKIGGNRDPAKHALLNLLKPGFDGLELIAAKANGFCEFAAFDGAGGLVDVVPDTIAVDFTVPAGWDTRLTPGLSCVRCHKEKDGFRTLKNDVLDLIRPDDEGGRTFDAFADLSEKDQKQAIDKIASSYRDNLSRLAFARVQYADAVYRSTGRKIADVCESIQKADDAYRAAYVTPERAALEWGVDVGDKPGAARDVLRRLLPPLTMPDGTTVREDPRIVALKRGINITRQDYEAIYADGAVRSMNEVIRMTRPWAGKNKPNEGGKQ